jgi:hypothetical protein
MRTLGFIGIFLLFLFVMIVLLMSVQTANWTGVAIATLMIGFLMLCTWVLWRGRRLERMGGRNVALDDWENRPLSRFFADQVAKSPEGRILLAGSGVSLLLALVSFVSPATMALRDLRAGGAIAILIVWPFLAFCMYVQLCGPRYRSSWFKRVAMLVIMCGPLYFIYK